MQMEKEYFKEKQILNLRSESSGEYPLPDYNGDVKKVMLVKPRVIPSGKFLGDGVVEYTGVVNYDIVYIDGENNITHADFSTDYDLAVKTDTEKYSDSDIDTRISMYNVRLTGPRKFSAKCSLESNIHINERCSYSIEGDGFSSYEPEVSKKDINVTSGVYVCGAEREYAEEMLTVEGAIVDEVEVLLVSADADVENVTVSDGKAELKGEMEISLVYRTPDKEINKLVRYIPYSESLDVNTKGTCVDTSCRVNILSVKANINPTDDGVSAVVSVIAEPHLRMLENDTVTVVKDAYLKECECENTYGEICYPEFCSASRDARNISCKMPIPDTVEGSVCEVCYAMCEVKCDECTAAENGAKMTGEAKFSLMVCALDADGNKSYAPIKNTVNFEEYVSCSCQKEEMCFMECDMNAKSIKAECDNEHLYLSCDADMKVRCTANKKERVVTECYATDTEYVRDDSVITVYYPERSESLFSVARKFHTSVTKIAADNLLTEAVFMSPDSSLTAMGTKKLLIK